MSQQVFSEVYAAATEASIRAAAAAMNALGGGIVHIPVGTIAITSALPIYPNVSYVGSDMAAVMTSPSYLKGGTIIDGQNLGINGFEYNPTDLGAPYGSLALLQASEAAGVTIKNIAIKRCAYGIKAGARYQGGCHSLYLDEVVAVNCSQWGFWLENCHNLRIGRIFAYNCAVGHSMVAASGTNLWNYGNFTVDIIIAEAASGTYPPPRGVCFIARNSSSMNDVDISHITCIGADIDNTISTTISNGSANVSVSDLSRFSMYCPVFTTTLVGGFKAYFTYFVTAMSGSSGAGTIQLSTSFGATAQSATANGTLTLINRGCAGVELAAYDSASFLTAMKIGLTDTEVCGVNDVTLQYTAISQVTLGFMVTKTPQLPVCLRLNDLRTKVFVQSTAYAIDTDTSSCWYEGTDVGNSGFDPAGIRWNLSQNAYCLRLDGNGRVLLAPDTTGTINQIGTRRAWADNTDYKASGATLGGFGSLVVYTGAGGGNLTLPVVGSTHVGLRYRISNPSSGAITLNTSSGLLFNNLAATTTFTIPANSFVDVSLCQTASASGVFYWAAK